MPPKDYVLLTVKPEVQVLVRSIKHTLEKTAILRGKKSDLTISDILYEALLYYAGVKLGFLRQVVGDEKKVREIITALKKAGKKAEAFLLKEEVVVEEEEEAAEEKSE